MAALESKYPGKQNMISFNRFKRHLESMGATVADAQLDGMEETSGLSKQQGYKCHYRMFWWTGSSAVSSTRRCQMSSSALASLR